MCGFDTLHREFRTGFASLSAMMERDFHRVIGFGDAATRFSTKQGRLPDEIAVCIGGGSNAMGIIPGIFWRRKAFD